MHDIQGTILFILSLNKHRSFRTFCWRSSGIQRSAKYTYEPMSLLEQPVDVPSEALAALIRSRRTIHKFLPTPISEDLLRDAIAVARWAPNHKLTEPWRFYLAGEQTVQQLAELNVSLFMEGKPQNARDKKLEKWLAMPSTTIVTFQKSGDALRVKEDYAATCCAIHNFSLYLWNRGVGVKWSTTGLIRRPEFYETLGIDPEHEEVVGILWAGYASEVPEKNRCPIQDIIRELP